MAWWGLLAVAWVLSVFCGYGGWKAKKEYIEIMKQFVAVYIIIALNVVSNCLADDIEKFKIDAQSAYHAISLAEEAYFAINNVYTDDFDKLKTEAGLIIAKNVVYSPIIIYQKDGGDCYTFLTSHKKIDILCEYDSCQEKTVKVLNKEKNLSEKAKNDNAAHSAYHTLALAEEAYFAVNNAYTDDYNKLKIDGGLVIDQDVQYSQITIYKNNGNECFKFSTSHKNIDIIYEYDSCREQAVKVVDKNDKLPEKNQYDNAAQSAYHAVALAEEAYFAMKNAYTDDYDKLKEVSGLVIDQDVQYSQITIYKNNDNECFKFATSHKKIDITYQYDSCGKQTVQVIDKNDKLPEKDKYNNVAQSAYHAVALAEEAYFAMKNAYTDDYDKLKEVSGLVIDQDVQYSRISLYKENGNECYIFGTTHKKIDIIYQYDSCQEKTVTVLNKEKKLSKKDQYKNAAQSAYHAVALAEEAYFAMKNAYTDDYDKLKEVSGLVIDENIQYSPITIYQNKGNECYKFKTSHENIDIIYEYDSCQEKTVTVLNKEKKLSEKDKYNNAAQSAYHAVALAEEAYFAMNSSYTNDYNKLKTDAGLVIDQNIQYIPITIYQNKGDECYKFKTSHENIDIIYEYDSCQEKNVKVVDKK
ncbi:MAG: hypothetical protein LBS60_14115 [Deltaproteobacteria bacterium]|nr:hypothetical protein [Deltaproteobacteria bacterium]